MRSPSGLKLMCSLDRPNVLFERSVVEVGYTALASIMVEDDTTLGGYVRVHDRPPAYEGTDGHPYTVSLEVEKTANLRRPFAGYLVFPRWAQSGVGVVGHVETPTLVECLTLEEATAELGGKTLMEVQDLLEDAIRHRSGGPARDGVIDPETNEHGG
jgi:hypothetical protein